MYKNALTHNTKWPYIPDRPNRFLIIGGSQSGQTNVLLNLIKYQQPDFKKICIYIKDPFEWKYQLLINGWEKVATEILKNPKAFIGYSQKIDEFYENLQYYNPTKKRRVLIVFDDLIADIESKETVSSIVTELFLRGRKLNLSLVFIS